MTWYSKVSENLANLPDFVSYYENELNAAKKETLIYGIVEKNIAALPGITEHRFSQLQEVEAVLNFLNIQLKKTRAIAFKKYLENYQRSLSSRDVEKYCDNDSDVVNMEILVNEIALLRNKWLSIIKGLESKQWQLGHIVKLRTAGMEDIMIS